MRGTSVPRLPRGRGGRNPQALIQILALITPDDPRGAGGPCRGHYNYEHVKALEVEMIYNRKSRLFRSIQLAIYNLGGPKKVLSPYLWMPSPDKSLPPIFVYSMLPPEPRRNGFQEARHGYGVLGLFEFIRHHGRMVADGLRPLTAVLS